MKSKLEEAFENYVKNFDFNEEKIRLKHYHSYRVRDLMVKLATALKLSDKEIEVAEVIGLLHYIGRFEQVKETGSFSDIKTGIDHADESCIYLFDKGHIKDFYDDENYYEIIKDAIKNHNKYVIDDKVIGKNLLFSKMIRDMDKVDIFRVIREGYIFEFDKNDVSLDVLNEFNKEQSIETILLKTKSDRVYSSLAFIYDINFKESFKILKESKYFDNVFAIINAKDDSKQELENIKNNLIDFINKKIETN